VNFRDNIIIEVNRYKLLNSIRRINFRDKSNIGIIYLSKHSDSPKEILDKLHHIILGNEPVCVVEA
jgi:hypothetical protein